MTDRGDWPVHQPRAIGTAPIPGTRWYRACSDGYPRVTPEGVCESCGATACPECGREECGPSHGVAA